MKPLFDHISDKVKIWRDSGYSHEHHPTIQQYPLIKELLKYQRDDERRERYLRSPQLLALETYWYLRLVMKTPSFLEMYLCCYTPVEVLESLGIPERKFALKHVPVKTIVEEFCAEIAEKGDQTVATLYESLQLDYPSYVFALAMGTGKTVLIGSIIATEFAMSLAYSEKSDTTIQFMQNALVFAPGTTIIESLREIGRIPYEKILPPQQYRMLMANMKLHYVTSGRRDIGTIANSRYNIVVTNTEKIILRKRRVAWQQEKEQLEENLRFANLSQLPSLGVFSDEAHHTYGNKLGDELKRVRQTIDRLHAENALVAVVNTTGTPYYKKQMLRDVVMWFGLREAIEQNILKSFQHNIKVYEIAGDAYAETAVKVIEDFFTDYKDVRLSTGQPAKIAFYFNRQIDLDCTKPVIEKALTNFGLSSAHVLVNTQQASPEDKEEFNSLNSVDSTKRVVLLVGKGREGWNCPSLFACALITPQTTSNNFVLQAAARCLRQVPDNTHPACIYLDIKNRKILDDEMQRNFGTTMTNLSYVAQQSHEVQVEILKPDIPKLEVTTTRRIWKLQPETRKPIVFEPPDIEAPELTEYTYHLESSTLNPTLVQFDSRRSYVNTRELSLHSASGQLARSLHFSTREVFEALQKAYVEHQTIPLHHMPELHKQAAACLGQYKETTEQINRVLTLIHIHDTQGNPLFQERSSDNGIKYFHTLRYSKTHFDHAKQLLTRRQDQFNDAVQHPSLPDTHDLSFHYSPYNFDSSDEQEFFKSILLSLNIKPDSIAGFYFMGGFRDPRKTDFWFEYKGQDRLYHRYFPDFVLIKHDGSCCIIEIKAENKIDNPDTQAKAKAIITLCDMQPDKLRYHLVYTNKYDPVFEWLRSTTS